MISSALMTFWEIDTVAASRQLRRMRWCMYHKQDINNFGRCFRPGQAVYRPGSCLEGLPVVYSQHVVGYTLPSARRHPLRV